MHKQDEKIEQNFAIKKSKLLTVEMNETVLKMKIKIREFL
jgi:hypothetical protein